MQRKFVMTFHEQGDLGADLDYSWTAPSGCTLVHVSAVQSDADACGITVGTSADPNGFLTTYSCGISGTPVEKESGDFDGALVTGTYPVISDGDIVTIDVDYDYNAGGGSGNAADVTIVLTFVEGGV